MPTATIDSSTETATETKIINAFAYKVCKGVGNEAYEFRPGYSTGYSTVKNGWQYDDLAWVSDNNVSDLRVEIPAAYWVMAKTNGRMTNYNRDFHRPMSEEQINCFGAKYREEMMALPEADYRTLTEMISIGIARIVEWSEAPQ